MVCEYLSREEKIKLQEIANVQDFINIGKKKSSAYALVNLRFVISDETCEKLISLLMSDGRREQVKQILTNAFERIKNEFSTYISD